jgi:hypothetical protein
MYLVRIVLVAKLPVSPAAQRYMPPLVSVITVYATPNGSWYYNKVTLRRAMSVSWIDAPVVTKLVLGTCARKVEFVGETHASTLGSNRLHLSYSLR